MTYKILKIILTIENFPNDSLNKFKLILMRKIILLSGLINYRVNVFLIVR